MRPASMRGKTGLSGLFMKAGETHKTGRIKRSAGEPGPAGYSLCRRAGEDVSFTFPEVIISATLIAMIYDVKAE